MSHRFRIVTGGSTHVGAVRSANEDVLFGFPDQRIWGVADGMGGHQRGDWAAARLADELGRARVGEDLEDNCDRIADSLEEANASIFDAGEQIGGTIGSTVVLLHVEGGRYACLWSGDSRAYLLSRGEFRQITRDHSQVEEMVAAGTLSREEARDHPLGNVITRAIGVAADLAVDCVMGSLQDNDRFLLCSDGLNRCLEDAEIGAIIGSLGPQEACDALVAACLDRGAPDNVTTTVIACEQMTMAFKPA